MNNPVALINLLLDYFYNLVGINMKLFNKLNGGNKYEGPYNIIPGTNNIVIPKNTLLTENLTIMGDSDLVASNIRKDVNLFGVNGTLEEGGIGNYTWEV